jgi:hypothetical protein
MDINVSDKPVVSALTVVAEGGSTKFHRNGGNHLRNYMK